MATEIQYSFYQLANAYTNGVLASEFQKAGNIIFDKTTHTLTVCKDGNANNNTIYGGGLKSASFDSTNGLTITDWDNNSVTLNKDNIVALLGGAYVTPTQLGTQLETIQNSINSKANKNDVYTKTEVDEAINDANVRIDKVEDGLADLVIPEYTIEKSATADDNASASYKLMKDGAQVGATINIPKDMVVSSGAVVENPTGQATGVYIELTLANATNDKLYIPVNQLVDDYTGSTYITVGTDGKIELNTTELSKVYASVDTVNGINTTVKQHTTNIQSLSQNKASVTDLEALEERVAAVEDLAGIGGEGDSGSLTERIIALEALSYWKELN